jgi:hypothetical protein
MPNQAGGITRTQLPDLESLCPEPAHPIIVLHYKAGPVPPVRWWPLLAAALAPGGLLFICGPIPAGFRTMIHATAPGLRAAEPHVIEPGQDGYWHLRPAHPAFRRLIDRQLQPPLGVRSWLALAQRPLRPPAGQVPCLPVWQTIDGA